MGKLVILPASLYTTHLAETIHICLVYALFAAFADPPRSLHAEARRHFHIAADSYVLQ